MVKKTRIYMDNYVKNKELYELVMIEEKKFKSRIRRIWSRIVKWRRG